jgi:hypothetical protein
MPDEVVYHFTDSHHLPWILYSGKLQIAGNRAGGYPEPSFLWATTDARGAKSASAVWSRHYRNGESLLIRFTLFASDFEPWRITTARYPAWTSEQIIRLERSARGCSPVNWRCRVDPLPHSRWIAIACRSYTNNNWRALPLDMKPDYVFGLSENGSLAIKIGDLVYVSAKIDDGINPVTYAVDRIPCQ